MIRFSVPFSDELFPPGTIPPHLNNRLSVTAGDLQHAAFVVGRERADQWTHGMRSVHEWLHRSNIVPAYLQQGAGLACTRSQLAVSLDRSEKVNLSYTLGQAFTAVFAEQVLGVAQLLHVDRYGPGLGIAPAPGTKSRPDLTGRRANGDWLVFEAKGRSNPPEAALRTKMRQQKQTIRGINGQAPTLAVGCVTSFEPPDDHLCLLAIDPTETQAEPISLTIDPDQFVFSYYAPMIELMHAGEFDTAAVGRMVISDVGTPRTRIELNRRLYERVRAAADDAAVSGLATDVDTILVEERTASDHLDGSTFTVDWSVAFSVDSRPAQR